MSVVKLGDYDALSDSGETAISIDHVSMIFNMASEQLNNLKEYAIALARRELRFKELRALDDISFEVKKGDVFGILGTNGSGKSTLLKIIAGVLDPSEGSCTINGSIAPLIELGAGFDMELTARENIYLNGALLGYSRAFINEHFDEIVSFAEVENFLDMPMKNYSSGMVARIAFAIATVIIPEILIVDEVLSVGDFMFQQKCERRIDTLIKDHQVTVLIVSHNNDQIERLCNKAVWIEKGHMRFIGDAKEVCRVYRVLGGHVGSEESEQQVLDILNTKADDAADATEALAAEDRYSSNIKMIESCGLNAFNSSTVVVAPGEEARACFIANSLAGLLEAPVVLARKDSVPDIAERTLTSLNPDTIVVVGGSQFIAESAIKQLEGFAGNVTVLDGTDFDELALQTYAYGKEAGHTWSKTALLTHPDCTADHMTFEPYSYQEKVPVFFNRDGVVQASTLEALHEGGFSRILMVGGPEIFDEDFMVQFKQNGTETPQFYGEGAYDASKKISTWIYNNANGHFTLDTLIISSLWMPENGFAVGPYAAKQHRLFLLEDPQDLDSVMNAYSFIQENQNSINKLVFLGGENKYSSLDRSILGKALKTAPQVD